ncbi:hydrogenase maturation nickel metallochaperone HypA [Geomonas sp. Red32]|uniref:hydrogenase maturation nickel metallochaperone HypA n=1 Tax=Geomonas sp. Red32 TaxID=2912856 RepID=UPI00202D0447|nr:hydrogenase maturation nickel metallochaperone HypA [Geomonas sp. Red32]MCM0082280.1 hydrogenase maturation nickel metallochaperone HypA [Geomonas sp. Red32]
MGGCGCGHSAGAGPYAEGRELVEFVSRAHGGTLKNERLPNGGLQAVCQGCGAGFLLATFVASCPACGGVHAVSPPRSNDPANIQFAGEGFRL